VRRTSGVDYWAGEAGAYEPGTGDARPTPE
jgi:hypothetical protein